MIPTEAAANKSPICRAVVTWRDGREPIHPPARPTIAQDRWASETIRSKRFHHRFQAEARRPLIAVIAEGIASGDFAGPVDPELATLALLGTIFFKRLMTNVPFEPERAGELVDTVLGRPRRA